MYSFNTLPKELQTSILNYNPKGITTSSYYYTDSYFKQEYFKRYCDMPITKDELISYITTYKPSKYYIYITKEDNKGFEKFIIFMYQHGTEKIKMSINEVDQGEFVIDIDPKLLYAYPKIQLDAFLDADFTVDVVTMYNILKLRSCEKIMPGYAAQKTYHDYINRTHFKPVYGLFSFYDNIKSVLIVLSNSQAIYDNSAFSDSKLVADNIDYIEFDLDEADEELTDEIYDIMNQIKSDVADDNEKVLAYLQTLM